MIVGNDRVARCSGPLKFLSGAVGLAGIVGMVTVREVAEILRCSKAHVCKIINGQVAGTSRLPAVGLGGRKLVRRANHGNYHAVSHGMGMGVWGDELEFVEYTYLPFYRGKWKVSTAEDNEGRLKFHLSSVYASRTVDKFDRHELQQLLNQKAAEYSYSVVAHLRWTLRQIFRMAVEEGYLDRNPAEILYMPREASHPNRKVMNKEEVKKLLEVLDPRERLIAQLAIIAGMRPGEILALTWGSLTGTSAEINRRLYRGRLDTPKTQRSKREAAFSDGLLQAIAEWRSTSPCTDPTAWVFPSEKLTTPVGKDNLWRRCFLPKLELVGLAWANFQVMRRTNSSLMKKYNVDPKVGADQRGHGIGVSLDVYTQSGREEKRAAVNTLEAALA